MSSPSVSVVLPAYKPDFLFEALESLACQSVQDFEVLVADDCSPHPIENIVRKFEGRLKLRYHRFAENLGGQSLAAHWSRCVRMTTTPWIWLFSDDDVADPDCMEKFLAALQFSINEKTSLFHFNTRIIDGAGHLIRVTQSYPGRMSARDYVRGRMAMKLSSFACEYIFSRAAFDQVNGFVEFPAAWCSDDASWVALTGDADIVTINGPLVSWRRSEKNISSPNSALTKLKADAMIAYLEWLVDRGFIGGDHSGKLALKWLITVLTEQKITLWFGHSIRAARAVARFDQSFTVVCMARLLLI